jgi:PAS domain S-box-containing protein
MAFAPACAAHESETLTTSAPAPAHAAPRARLRPADLGLGSLFELVHDAVVVAGLSSGEIVLWNPGAERLFGYTPAEVIGQPVHILMPPGIAHLHHAAVGRYIQTGRGLIINADAPVEVPAVTKDGTDLRVEVTLRELRGPRGERFALAIMRDMKHRRDAELQRLEIDRVRRQNEALLAALAAATHDVEVDG